MSFVGVDVSAKTLDVAVEGGATWQVTNDAAGLATLLAQLAPLAPDLIIVEPTGRYHQLLAATCIQAGLPVAVVNPRQVRDFARSPCRGRCRTRPRESWPPSWIVAASSWTC